MASSDPINSLQSLLATMSDGQLVLLEEMARAIVRPIHANYDDRSDIATDRFVRGFSARLLLFHAMHDAALTKKTFEYMFVAACRTDGREARIVRNSVNAGEDAVVDGIGFSLKTEGSKSTKRNHLHISKLMEARWIRECRSPEDFADGLKRSLSEHLACYDRILSLRSWPSDEKIEYQLVEIPKETIAAALDLNPRRYSRRTGSGSCKAEVYDADGGLLFVLSLDGSVEKVTIRRLAISACRVHAEWVVSA